MHTFSIKRNIALKVSIFIVIFIVILQFISGVISVKSGQWLGEMVENSVVEIVQNNVENLEKTSSADLKELITFNTKMLAGIIRPILYNVEDVKPTLLSFMDVKEIQAVVVFDEEKKSVGAVWRGQGVNKGAALPGDFDTGKLLTSQTKVKNEGSSLGDVVIYYTDKILKDEIAASKKATLERLNAGLKNVEQSQSSVFLWQIVGINGIVIVFLLVMFWLITRILRPLKHLSDVIEDVEKSGMLDRRANVQSEDEIGRTAAAYNKQMTSLQTAVNDITHVVRGLSQGDLQLRVEGGQKGDIEELGNNINQSLEMLSETISRIITSSEQVNTGATEMASSSQDLAKGTSEQAASLEQASSSMSEVGAQTRVNNENAQQAQVLTSQTLDIVQKGTEQMNAMLGSMNEINTTSSSVTKIIKVIDEIAFQTNLLALNAAVEAARAGKYGKGFAVVAEEVRNLAARSAEAAKNTTELIETSAREVEKGVSNAEKTAAILAEIDQGVKKVNEMVSEITAATELQTTGIEEINKGLTQINQIVQQNSAISEESASSSTELSSQASSMMTLMKQFRLRKKVKPSAAVAETRVTMKPKVAMKPKAAAMAQLESELTDPDRSRTKALPRIEAAPMKAESAETGKGKKPNTIVLDDDDFGKY